MAGAEQRTRRIPRPTGTANAALRLQDIDIIEGNLAISPKCGATLNSLFRRELGRRPDLEHSL